MEKLFSMSQVDDPVFDGMVRDFMSFEKTMNDIYRTVEAYMNGMERMCEGMQRVSTAMIDGLTKLGDELVTADACKFSECTNSITRADAPHSAYSKLKRDLDYNITQPLLSHMENNQKVHKMIKERSSALDTFKNANTVYERIRLAGLPADDSRLQSAEKKFLEARKKFREADHLVFEWLHILEDYRGDIYDSTVQTMKFLQYDFFSAASQNLSRVLPPRMEFRPMLEMTPERLEPEVFEAIEEHADEVENEENPTTNTTCRVLDRWANEGSGPQTKVEEDEERVEPDMMSVAILTAQGFDEVDSMNALALHNNEMQKAVDWIIAGMPSLKKEKPKIKSTSSYGSVVPASKAAETDEVRMPSTLRRVQKAQLKRKSERDARMKRREQVAIELAEAEEKERIRKEEKRIRKELKKAKAAAAAAAAAATASPANANVAATRAAPSSSSANLLSVIDTPSLDVASNAPGIQQNPTLSTATLAAKTTSNNFAVSPSRNDNLLDMSDDSFIVSNPPPVNSSAISGVMTKSSTNLLDSVNISNDIASISILNSQAIISDNMPSFSSPKQQQQSTTLLNFADVEFDKVEQQPAAAADPFGFLMQPSSQGASPIAMANSPAAPSPAQSIKLVTSSSSNVNKPDDDPLSFLGF